MLHAIRHCGDRRSGHHEIPPHLSRDHQIVMPKGITALEKGMVICCFRCYFSILEGISERGSMFKKKEDTLIREEHIDMGVS